jgi:hypothetical protein
MFYCGFSDCLTENRTGFKRHKLTAPNPTSELRSFAFVINVGYDNYPLLKRFFPSIRARHVELIICSLTLIYDFQHRAVPLFKVSHEDQDQ